jgi:S-adenosylmethionine/arginine decarboxylase-like enzyme
MHIRDSYKRTYINGNVYYGKHLMITATNCNRNILEIDAISRFIKELVPKIDMTAYGDVIIARFGEGEEIGISAVQLIITSSITIHTNDMARDMYLDVFSCKWFDDDVVIRFVEEYFAPGDIKETVMLRR